MYFRSRETFPDLPRCCQRGSITFIPVCSHDHHLKLICSNSYMPRFHLLSYLCRFATSLLSLSRVLLSVHLSQTARIARVALFLGNIRAPTPQRNHCIFIARYFVSRCPLLYVLYYLARLDSGCVSVNRCTSNILQLDCASLPLYRNTVNTTTNQA